MVASQMPQVPILLMIPPIPALPAGCNDLEDECRQTQAREHARVEIEKYNAKPVKNPPPDELITFQTKADHEGIFVTTLPDAGTLSTDTGAGR